MSNFSALNASHGIGRHVIPSSNQKYVTLSFHTLGQQRLCGVSRDEPFQLTIRGISGQHNGPGVSPGPITCVWIVIDPLSWSVFARWPLRCGPIPCCHHCQHVSPTNYEISSSATRSRIRSPIHSLEQ